MERVAPDDDQHLDLGYIYRLESAVMPWAVWNGSEFVGPRERFHLRLLETVKRAEGGWVTKTAGPIDGVPLVAELQEAVCTRCEHAPVPACEARGHPVIEEAVPNRALLAAIDETIAPWLEDELQARAAQDVDEIMVRAFRWESRHGGERYQPSESETAAIHRRLDQLTDDESLREVIERRFPVTFARWQDNRDHVE